MRLTPARIEALRYARGDDGALFPTRGVSRPLEKEGLIVWTAYRPGATPLERYYAAQDGSRGWSITARGRELLKSVED